MEEYRRQEENEQESEQEKKEVRRGIRIMCLVFAIVAFLLIDCVFFVVLLGRGMKEGKFPKIQAVFQHWYEVMEAGESEKKETEDYFNQIAEKEKLTARLGTAYEGLWRLWEDDTRYLAKKNGMWGMVDIYGTEIVPFVYENYSGSDAAGWVEFAKQTGYSVFDRNGNMVQGYPHEKKKSSGVTENEVAYQLVMSYMGGMQMKTYLPEDADEDFYGISYKNRNTLNIVYEAVGNYYDAGIFSFPDKEGRAAAIRGDGTKNTLYLITEDGCVSRELELPEGVYFRYFDFPGDYRWADMNFSNGWLRVYVYDKIAESLLYKDDIYMASLNVETLELVRFPEEYQKFYLMYDEGYGELMALANYQENAETYKYAICKGDRVLTEEKYERILWHEKYIIGETESQTEILNHEGEVLATYPVTGGDFVNGKMIVYDGTGVYYINEELEKCSSYVLMGKIDDCFSAGVIIDGEWYLMDDRKLGETAVASIPRGKSPNIFEKYPEGHLETVHWEMADRTSYVNRSVFALSAGDLFTVADYEGKTIIEEEHRYYYHYDEEWICLVDENMEGHVYDTAGNLLYRHTYEQNGLTTEEGIVYTRYTQYARGFRMEQDIAEGDEVYYAVHYYNAETGELIFEAFSTKNTILMNTLPDESGRAVVIMNAGEEMVLCQITTEGYHEYSGARLNQGKRKFYYSDFIDWRQSAMSEGWVKLLVADPIVGPFETSESWQEVLFHVDSYLTVPLPEKYQGYSDYYTASAKGLYYGITALTEEEYYGKMQEPVYYAVCRGSEILTEEIYTWIQFDETYILAGNERFAHILDYEGKVKAEYTDIGTVFQDGKLLVYDGKGVFFIEESDLSVCTDYLMETDSAACGVRTIWGPDGVYLMDWEEETEE